MTLWYAHPALSSEFLAEHHDLVVWNTYHHVKACLLYPPGCTCMQPCRCKMFRKNIVLSLNVPLYNQAEDAKADPESLRAIQLVLGLPNDHFWRRHAAEIYPLWLVDEEFYKREEDNHFKAVSRLVWTLLRLARTYEISNLKKGQASVTEALEVILGKNPLKKENKKDYLCGEKAYEKYFKIYRSVCHFIAASEHLREEGKNPLYLSNPHQITKFLHYSEEIRRHLLSLKTPNIQGKALFSEEILMPLPLWVCQKQTISLQPFQDKLDEINKRNHPF